MCSLKFEHVRKGSFSIFFFPVTIRKRSLMISNSHSHEEGVVDMVKTASLPNLLFLKLSYELCGVNPTPLMVKQ